jgi:hypothetical protein
MVQLERERMKTALWKEWEENRKEWKNREFDRKGENSRL